MSHDKAIAYGKEHRKPYTGAQAIDHTCRNHGSCGWCEGNRLYQRRKAADVATQKMTDYETEMQQ